MASRFYTRALGVAAFASVLTACGGKTLPVIVERHDNYHAIGDAFKAIRTQLESGEPDTAAIAASASEINQRAQKISGYFPEGTGIDAGYDTEALATIWEQPAEFEAATQKLIDESAKLAAVAQDGDAAAIGEQTKAMGGACKGCHDKFRLDDD